MIAVDKDGNFVTKNGRLDNKADATVNYLMAEFRCTQGTYMPLPNFGRNPIVWTISQSITDRIADVTRIALNYIHVQYVTYQDGRFQIA